jgi:hypothetical protein
VRRSQAVFIRTFPWCVERAAATVFLLRLFAGIGVL